MNDQVEYKVLHTLGKFQPGDIVAQKDLGTTNVERLINLRAIELANGEPFIIQQMDEATMATIVDPLQKRVELAEEALGKFQVRNDELIGLLKALIPLAGDISTLTVAQLTSLAGINEIPLLSGAKKDDIIAALKA